MGSRAESSLQNSLEAKAHFLNNVFPSGKKSGVNNSGRKVLAIGFRHSKMISRNNEPAEIDKFIIIISIGRIRSRIRCTTRIQGGSYFRHGTNNAEQVSWPYVKRENLSRITPVDL